MRVRRFSATAFGLAYTKALAALAGFTSAAPAAVCEARVATLAQLHRWSRLSTSVVPVPGTDAYIAWPWEPHLVARLRQAARRYLDRAAGTEDHAILIACVLAQASLLELAVREERGHS